MARDAAGLVARDELALTCERDRFDDDAGFLGDLADHGLMQRLAHFNNATRKGVQARARALGAPRHQHMPVAYDRGADGQIRPLRIHPRIVHDDFALSMILSENRCPLFGIMLIVRTARR